MEPLNNIDVVILIGVVLSMLVAFIRGFVKQVLSNIGLALFIIITTYLTPILTPWMNQFIKSTMMAQFVVFLLVMAIFYAFWIIGTDKLIARIRKSTLSFMDRLFGLLFGFLRAVLILGFCFLITKIVMPEELKNDGSLKKSQYFMMAEPCSDLIEAMLPKDFIKNMMDSVENVNKADAKKDKEQAKEKKKSDDTAKEPDKIEGLPSKLDQEQMDKMFELLVKPEIKDVSRKEKSKDKPAKETIGYDSKETNSLDRLIDITAE